MFIGVNGFLNKKSLFKILLMVFPALAWQVDRFVTNALTEDEAHA